MPNSFGENNLKNCILEIDWPGSNFIKSDSGRHLVIDFEYKSS